DERPRDRQCRAAQIVGLVAEPNLGAEGVRFLRDLRAREPRAKQVVVESHVGEDRDARELRAGGADARPEARTHREDEADARDDDRDDYGQRLDEPHRARSAAEESLNGLGRCDLQRARALLARAEASPEDEAAPTSGPRSKDDGLAGAVELFAVEKRRSPTLDLPPKNHAGA